MADFWHQFFRFAFADDFQFAVFNRDFQSRSGQCAAENDAFGILRDVDKAAWSGNPRTKFRHVDVADFIEFRHAQAGQVQAAAVIEVELAGVIDDRQRVDRATEPQAAAGNAADQAGLYCRGQLVDDAFFRRHCRHAFRHADPQVDDRFGNQFHRRPTANDLAVVECDRFDIGKRHPYVAGQGAVVAARRHAHRLGMVFRFGHHDGIYQCARHNDVARIDRAGLGDPFDLYDDLAARVLRGQRLHIKLQTNRFLFDADIAKLVGGCAANDRHIDRERLVPEIFFAFQLDQFYDFAGRALVQSAAGFPRVGEGFQADMGDNAGFFAADGTVQMHHDALGNRVGFALLRVDHFDHIRLQVEVTGDDLADQAFLAPTVQAPVRFAVILGSAVSQRQVVGSAGIEKTFFDSFGNFFGMTHADKTANGNRCPRFDEFYRFFRSHDLVFQRTTPPVILENPTTPLVIVVKIITHLRISLRLIVYCNIHANPYLPGFITISAITKKRGRCFFASTSDSFVLVFTSFKQGFVSPLLAFFSL